MLGLRPSILISRIVTLVIAFTVHEFAHAWTATQLGDDTPSRFGRLSLNPLVHLDLLGSLLLVTTGFGWAKPVPINPYALRNRSRAGLMLVAAAGPLSNLLLALFASLPFRAGLLAAVTTSNGPLPTPSAFLNEFIWINLILLFLNLIPIAPLDGEKVIGYFLPPEGQDLLLRIQPYGPVILLSVLFILPFLGINLLVYLVGAPANWLSSLLVS
jgi:Zn-dependent protease